MSSMTKVTSVLVVVAAFAPTGCRVDGSDEPWNGSLAEAALHGVWVRATEHVTRTMTFDADGTFAETYEEEGSTDRSEGYWSVDDGMLELEIREDEDGWMCVERFAETAAIVEGHLLVGGLLVRTRGSSAGLDGTWETAEAGYFEWSEGPYGGWERYTYRETLSISGDRYTVVEEDGEEAESEEGSYSFVDEYESRGEIRLDGDRVYSAITEIEGEPTEYREEVFIGFRVAPNVIRTTGAETDDPLAGTFVRQ